MDQELLIYEAFNHDSQLGQTNLKVRFKKVSAMQLLLSFGWLPCPIPAGRSPSVAFPPSDQVPHNINFREKKPRPSKKKPDGAGGEDSGAARGRVARFRFFEDIYGYSGVSRAGVYGEPGQRRGVLVWDTVSLGRG